MDASEESVSVEYPITPEMSKSCRRLSTVSKLYDRHGKGFLDNTELALRRMDSQNKGFLDVNKVYEIMESLQDEHAKNSQLIETLRTEARRNLRLKKGIIFLCVFTILLAAANIATSFAAARLAKDTRVSRDYDLTSTSGVRLGTTSKGVAIAMNPLPASRRRRLMNADESFVCSYAPDNTNCTLQGEVNRADAETLYEYFCPGWTATGNCTGGGVAQVTLTCNNHQSIIFGAPYLPPETPSIQDDRLVFPSTGRSYQGRAGVYLHGVPLPCQQDFSLGMSCPLNGTKCDVFTSWDPTCAGGVELCGEPSVMQPM